MTVIVIDYHGRHNAAQLRIPSVPSEMNSTISSIFSVSIVDRKRGVVHDGYRTTLLKSYQTCERIPQKPTNVGNGLRLTRSEFLVFGPCFVTPPVRLPVIGLIGGIGSGKSSVAQSLAARRNIAVIDVDAIGHRVLEQTAVKTALRKRFGAQIFGNTGQVDRSALAKQVFGPDAANQNHRHDLEQIVHPVIGREISDTINRLQASGDFEAVCLDAAVLLEAGWRNVCDAVVFVETPLAQRRQRVALSRGWSPEELQRRENSQLSLEKKRQEADFVIRNDASLEEASRQFEEILNQILSRNV